MVNDYAINSRTIQLAKVGGNDSKGINIRQRDTFLDKIESQTGQNSPGVFG